MGAARSALRELLPDQQPLLGSQAHIRYPRDPAGSTSGFGTGEARDASMGLCGRQEAEGVGGEARGGGGDAA